MMQTHLDIVRLGSRGDGVAETESGPVFVPFSLPGDQVLVELANNEGRLLAIEKPSPHRVDPICGLFGQCGGCLIQHADPMTYSNWKRGLVVAALAPLGANTIIAPLVAAHGEGRRRVTFHARRQADETACGFMMARSHSLVQVEACPILVPGLMRAPSVAKVLAERLTRGGKPLDVAVTDTLGGLDVDIRGHGRASSAMRMALAREADTLGLARLSMHGDIIVERHRPDIAVGKARVVSPPGGFLQATVMGEAILAEHVLAATAKAGRVADLFAGIGTFALRLAEHHQVHAVESSAAAVAALQRGAREAQGLKPLTAETRDLFRRPLLPIDLERYDAVVLDPPRAGAEAQMHSLALSKVPTVVSVSCHLGSFVRDAEILIAGGYTLVSVTPVDQFLYSSHIELVGVFERSKESVKRVRRALG